jgi:S-methylmethionine-dependent homocysteine/selenocysteine methylase
MGKVPEGWTLDNELYTGRRADVTTDYFVEKCLRAAEAGATIIGGCCGIGPTDIEALTEALTIQHQ